MNKKKSSIWSILTKPFRTKQYRLCAKDYDRFDVKHINILRNNDSLIIPSGVYPSYDEIDNYVKYSKPSLFAIDNLLASELKRHGITTNIIENVNDIEDSYRLEYQDYWAWDFKKYMPVLVITLLNQKNEEVLSVISEGNTMGLHDYPNPKKQVPLLVDLLFEYDSL